MNPLITKFATAPVYDAMKMILCAFELETQETEGVSTDGDNEDNFDEDSYNDAVSSRVSDIMNESIWVTYGYCPALYKIYQACGGREAFKKIAAALEVTTLHEYGELTDSVSDIEENVQQSVEEDSDLRAEYTHQGSQDDLPSLPDGLTVCDDGSVSGFEFKPDGPVTAKRFVSLARQILDWRHKIDINCSFHIHLSVPGIEHNYGKQLQLAMSEYIIDQRDKGRFSKALEKRLMHDSQYFNIRGTTEKYNFVNFHNGFKTWEFRCFGNVSNISDASTCLIVAVEALQYAYRTVKLGEPRLGIGIDLTPKDLENIRFNPANDTGVTLRTFAKIKKRDQAEALDLESLAA